MPPEINSPSGMTGTLPPGPLHRGNPPYVLKYKGPVDTALIDVVGVANPSVEFQISCVPGDVFGQLKFVVPLSIDPGMYKFSARLIPLGGEPEGTVPEQEIEVI